MTCRTDMHLGLRCTKPIDCVEEVIGGVYLRWNMQDEIHKNRMPTFENRTSSSNNTLVRIINFLLKKYF